MSTEQTQPRGLTTEQLKILMDKVIASAAMQASVRRQGEAWRAQGLKPISEAAR